MSDSLSRKQKKEEESEDDEQRKERKSEETNNTTNDTQPQREESSDEEETGTIRQNLLQYLLAARNIVPRLSNNEDLVRSLKKRSIIKSEDVEQALLKLPRPEFVTKDVLEEACEDCPIRLPSFGFNVSAPHMYGICLENLDLKPGLTVLDIGSGCGHFTCLAGYLVGKNGKAIGLDIRQDIIDFANANKKRVSEGKGIDLGNVEFYVRNCFLPTARPEVYDRIHVGACCPEAQLDNLVKKLAPGGILVTPYTDKIVKVTKDKDGKYKMEKLMAVRYGDLIIPSEAEIQLTKKQIEKEKSTTILIPENPFIFQLENLINNKEISDISLEIEGKFIYGHKVILAARSPFFKALFFGGLKESKQEKIKLENLNYNSFLDCLKYIYTGTLEISDADHAIEIIGTSNYLKLDHLKSICEKIIAGNIEIETAAYSLGIATLHNCTQLKSFCLNFIISNFEQVSKTKGFEELSKSLILEVTREACKSINKNE